MTIHSSLQKKLLQKHRQQVRVLFPKIYQISLNFSSQDFLNLLNHQYIRNGAIDYIMRWGSGSSITRPLDDFLVKIRRTQEKLAELVGKESAILLESNTNHVARLIDSLIQPKTVILKNKTFQFHPKYNVEMKIFDPKDANQLESMLKTANNYHIENILILVDSHQTHDNNGISNLKKIADLSKEYKAILIADDTFTFQILGKYGMGLSSHLHDVDIIVGGFGKPFGSYAYYIASSKKLMNYIIHFNHNIDKLSTISPLLIGAIDKSLDIIPSMQSEREELLKFSKITATNLKNDNWHLDNHSSNIMSISFDKEGDVRQMQTNLTQAQCIANCHTNLKNVDFLITSSHSTSTVNELIKILRSYRCSSSCESL